MGSLPALFLHSGLGVFSMNDQHHYHPIDRRQFLHIQILSGIGLLSAPAWSRADELSTLMPSQMIGNLQQERGEAPLAHAVWYTAQERGQGLEYRFEPEFLNEDQFLSADFLVDGNFLVVMRLELQEGENGPTFNLSFKGLNQCSARIRFALAATNMNRWRMEREGAWLKPLCGGRRVDLGKVDRMRLIVASKSHEPARWCMTPFTVLNEEPAPMREIVLPKGPLLDELGQSTIHEWPQRTRDEREMTARLKNQLQEAETAEFPKSFSVWGGCREKKIHETGFFKTHHDGKRWWLVDPDGHLFWSAGLDCVRSYIQAQCRDIEQALAWLPESTGPYREVVTPEMVNHLGTNFIRAFGAEAWQENWAKIALGQMKNIGFNTVGNWSEWQIAREAKVPYVRPINFRQRGLPLIYRDFPDVFDSRFEGAAREYAEQLRETKDDPAFIGYFLMNEPTWGFASESPAAGMLFNTPDCEARKRLAQFLGEKYGDSAALSKAWDIETTLEAIEKGPWKTRLTPAAEKDLNAFSEIMVDRFFGTLTDACRKVDPNHLNLGVRYHTVPPEWALKGMRSFDVFSMNCYRDKIPAGDVQKIASLMNVPVIIGEYHFGALDVGLPSPGLRHVRTQAARGQAFRVYTEDAAANPYCVGVHYFTLYDQSALGRFDGENYNIGFLDVCNRPYEPLCKAARLSHERLYEVALGRVEPYNDAPEFLPNLF